MCRPLLKAPYYGHFNVFILEWVEPTSERGFLTFLGGVGSVPLMTSQRGDLGNTLTDWLLLQTA